jgi:potassium voltage-gated channel KQT-like subfamily protein 1
MSIRRKSTVSHALNLSHARASVVSLYSALDPHDDDRNRFFRRFSALFLQKTDVYHVLERQEGTRTLAYHLFVFGLTLISLVFGSISTIQAWRPTLDAPLYYGELVLCIFFASELLLRIWSAGCLSKYRTWVGRLKFISRPVIVLDILTLFGFTLLLATGMKTGEFPSVTLICLPPLQMIRFLRVDRQLTSWTILKGTIITHRQELTVTLVIAFMFLITGSYLVYIAETPMNPNSYAGPFRSLADTMWFSIISVIFILTIEKPSFIYSTS